MKNCEFNKNMVGKFVNYYGWSDVECRGKIIGGKGKSILILKEMNAGENKTKMEWVAGGFAGHCTNNYAQSYDFTEGEKTYEVRVSKKFFKYNKIEDAPRKFYDFNF